jgi:hypothetical protein
MPLIATVERRAGRSVQCNNGCVGASIDGTTGANAARRRFPLKLTLW